MIYEDNIKKLIEEKLSGTEKFLVSLKIHSGNRIVVYIDSDNSVNIDDCAELSRFIESQFDREAEDFELEVSSAGLTQPLILKRQYVKNIDREVKSVLKNGTVIKGIIKEVNETGFVLLQKITQKDNKKKRIIENNVSVPFNEVKETKLVINI